MLLSGAKLPGTTSCRLSSYGGPEMPCEEFKSAECKYKGAQSMWAQYAYEANKHLWGVSETRRKQILREKRAEMDECSQIMERHRSYCETCKAEWSTQNRIDR